MWKAIVTAISLTAAGIAAAPAGASPVMQAACDGAYRGAALHGVLSVSRIMTAMQWEISGRFVDPMRNVYEFEVLTPNSGGTGGLWRNGARHRESHVFVQLYQGGFGIRLESGETLRFTCA